ncbi:hypothetical protein GW933_03640 [Candidatus Falkowbacteria bacterium]|uniref:Uncharacterized protein n=1 Tax=Candidatus Buchananbacteria bacterium CG10_big_fil_rev_8_21_14_0_10_33_19 TaxID=1974525 RepID=A0A2H0W4A6_9BACT|nr:hypothetical protein [Candidatus Falkowbacteria bacterium]PIS06107.1 MAG: hypothetical protein COT80_02445 [Candidatus Buchananbacteria bacterium CG10_big_fil_rev_8_21_14_0_10_33_19]
MPPTKKKVTKKRVTKITKPKTSPKKTPTNKKFITENDKEFIPEKQFINVYDQDPVIQAKSRLIWIIVGLIMLIIIAFWFWSLKQSINKNNKADDLSSITTEIDDIVKQFKNIVGNTPNITENQNQNSNTTDALEKIKTDVLSQIQINSDSDNWPEHSSKLLNLSLKYPTNWFKSEKKDLLTIANYDLESTTTPEIFTKITITKIDKANDDLKDYQPSNEEIFIDLLPATKYNNKTATENTLSYLLFITSDKNIYRLDIYSSDQSIFENTINKILSTIDLL